jgi:hypothetical protein
MRPRSLAGIRQHKSILEGIRTRDPKKARVAFVRSTANYWNEQYGLSLDESAFSARESEPEERQLTQRNRHSSRVSHTVNLIRSLLVHHSTHHRSASMLTSLQKLAKLTL